MLRESRVCLRYLRGAKCDYEDSKARWDIKPSTATRLRNKAQGWTEVRGPTLGIEQASCRYTEGVM
jgi:hypothetical protein